MGGGCEVWISINKGAVEVGNTSSMLGDARDSAWSKALSFTPDALLVLFFNDIPAFSLLQSQ